jgi:hypothetical protein
MDHVAPPLLVGGLPFEICRAIRGVDGILQRAKAEGRGLGRPAREVDPVRLKSVIRRGLSARDGARELGISASSFARLAGALPRTASHGTTDATM